MLDIHACLRSILLGDPTVNSLSGGNVAWPDLPAGVNPAEGQKALTFEVRGGPFNPELTAVAEPSIALKAWALKPSAAMELFAAVYDLLDAQEPMGNASGTILSAYPEQPGQPLFDPDTGWAFVLGFFKLVMVGTPSVPGVIPGLVASGRHSPVETPDGIRMSFTFLGIPLDPTKFLILYNGQGIERGFTQVGEVITFDTIVIAPGDELFAFY